MIERIADTHSSITVYIDEFSRRLRVDDYTGTPAAVAHLLSGQIQPWVEKLILKSRPVDVAGFLAAGFVEEAVIPRYFHGVDMHFLVKYLNAARQISKYPNLPEEMLREFQPPVSAAIETRKVVASQPYQAVELASLYARCFPVYPTPVYDAAYVRQTMAEGTLYGHLEVDGEIVSAASAEINWQYRNAELTDCASDARAQGKGHMKQLLFWLEKELVAKDIHCLYTIARTESLPMNKVFHQLRYTFGGRMIKNCNIYSGIEDMNVWYKNIQP